MSAQLGEYEESEKIAKSGIPLGRRGNAADMAARRFARRRGGRVDLRCRPPRRRGHALETLSGSRGGYGAWVGGE